ncbi:MAG: hypothetical protein Q9160_005796 [Pyrenula sp. 1 TL-2023]
MSAAIPTQMNGVLAEDEALTSSGIIWVPGDIAYGAGPAGAPQEVVYSSDNTLSNTYFSMPSYPYATQTAPSESDVARYLSIQPNATCFTSNIAVSFLTPSHLVSTKNVRTENSKDNFNASAEPFPAPAYRSMGSVDSGFQSKIYQQPGTSEVHNGATICAHSVPVNKRTVQQRRFPPRETNAFQDSEASRTPSFSASKRRKTNPSLKDSIRPADKKISANASQCFYGWAKTHPGKNPDPETIKAFIQITGVPYEEVHAWFYYKSISCSHSESPENQRTETFDPCSSMIQRDPCPSMDDVCHRASEYYCENRKKCHTLKTEAEMEKDRKRKFDPERRFLCTNLCGASFHFKSDWIRHEHNSRPQEGWICDLEKTWSDGDKLHCTMCPSSNPDAGHFQRAHKGKKPCNQKGLTDEAHGRVFFRKDKMKEHLKRHHPHLDSEKIVDRWAFPIRRNFEERCGFCGNILESWKQRNECIARHFQQGKTMQAWHDDWATSSFSQAAEDGRHANTSNIPGRSQMVCDRRGDKSLYRLSTFTLEPQDGDQSNDFEREIHDDYDDDNGDVHSVSDESDNSSDKDEEDDDEDDEDDEDDDNSDNDDDPGTRGPSGNSDNDYNGSNNDASQNESRRNQEHEDPGGSSSGNTEAGDDANGSGSAYFDFDAYSQSRVLYKALKHVFLGISAGIRAFAGVEAKLQRRIFAFSDLCLVQDALMFLQIDTQRLNLSVQRVKSQAIHEKKLIGLGALSSVFEVHFGKEDTRITSESRLLAAKRIRKHHTQLTQQISLLKEFVHMSILRHHHTFRSVGLLLRHFECKLIMPKADCTLRELLNEKMTSPLLSLNDLGCLASAVAHVHEQGIVHLDLKPENILVIKHGGGIQTILADFGASQSEISKECTSEEKRTFTPKYASKETIMSGAATRASDIFSLGCIFLEIVACLTHKQGLGNAFILDPKLPYHSANEVTYPWLYRLSTSKQTLLTLTQIYILRIMLDSSSHVRPSAKRTLRDFSPRSCCRCFQDSHGPKTQRAADKFDKPQARVPAKLNQNNFRMQSPLFTKDPCEKRRPYPALQPDKQSLKKASDRLASLYDSLDCNKQQIRLFTIKTGPGIQALLELSIQTFDLIDAPKYAALSYVWGNPNINSQQILLNSHRVRIGQNLHAALDQMKKPDLGSMFLWVDAICINQNDIIERGQQVAMMGKIYGNAARVIVWLGSSDHYTKSSFELLHRIQRQRQKSSPNWWIKQENYLTRPYAQKALRSLLRRPWFSRAWVIQEVVLAKDAYVCCGQDELSWQDLESAVSFLVHEPDNSEPDNSEPERGRAELPGHCSCAFAASPSVHFGPAFHLHKKLSIFERLRNNVMRMPLMELLERLRDWYVTDPRDRVFALLGLSSDASTLAIRPDYSMTKRELFTFVALQYLKSLQNLYMMTLLAFTDDDALLPSWVPDWSLTYKSSQIGWQYFSASNGSSLECYVEATESRLCVKGISLSTVKRMSKSWDLYEQLPSHSAASSFLSDVHSLAQHSRYGSSNGSNIAEVAWMTCTSGLELGDHGKWQQSVFSHTVYRQAISEASTRDIFEFNQSGLKIERFRRTLSIRCKSRLAFLTTSGHLGVGPSSMRPGDHAVVLFGSNVPVILRENLDDTFKVVGECYVYGMMHGEIMDENLQSRNFVLV